MVRGDSGGAHDARAQPGNEGIAAHTGPFGTTLDLLESGVLSRRGIRRVSLCGHPEGIGAVVGVDQVRRHPPCGSGTGRVSL